MKTTARKLLVLIVFLFYSNCYSQEKGKEEEGEAWLVDWVLSHDSVFIVAVVPKFTIDESWLYAINIYDISKNNDTTLINLFDVEFDFFPLQDSEHNDVFVRKAFLKKINPHEKFCLTHVHYYIGVDDLEILPAYFKVPIKNMVTMSEYHAYLKDNIVGYE